MLRPTTGERTPVLVAVDKEVVDPLTQLPVLRAREPAPAFGALQCGASGRSARSRRRQPSASG
jgi:hypothetical protein